MHLSVTEKHLFGKEWMDAFKKIWNNQTNASSQRTLAGTGAVSFAMILNEKVIRSTVVQWGKDGKIVYGSGDKVNSLTPAFTAPSGVWESVIYSYYTTIQAVVNKKMEFEGKIKFAITFSKKFPLIANVAIAVNQRFMHG